MYSSEADVALVPPGDVTVMSRVPTACDGMLGMVIVVELTRLKHGFPGHCVEISVRPTSTSEAAKPAPSKSVPVTVMPLPPAAGPSDGDTPVTVGAGT